MCAGVTLMAVKRHESQWIRQEEWTKAHRANTTVSEDPVTFAQMMDKRIHSGNDDADANATEGLYDTGQPARQEIAPRRNQKQKEDQEDS